MNNLYLKYATVFLLGAASGIGLFSIWIKTRIEKNARTSPKAPELATPPIFIEPRVIESDVEYREGNRGGRGNEFDTLFKQAVSEHEITRREEIEVLNGWRFVIGKTVDEANIIAKSTGYTFHPIYVSEKSVNKLKYRSNFVIGVKTDKDMKILDLVDVGGNDIRNRGN